MEKDYYQSYEYWFENQEQLDEVSNYDEGYYAYKIFEHYLPKLEIPKEGYIVLMGTNKCVSFNLLCKLFGEDRCIGYDLYNPTRHSKVITKDCNSLGNTDDLPIAFAHNDIGNFPKTPELKLHVQHWLARNTIEGGVVLGRNNYNSKKIDMEKLMEEYGFENTNFRNLGSEFDLNILNEDEVISHMFSRKVKSV